jgi:hypothetical protein
MAIFPTGPTGDVFVLGAGFSKALSDSMPLTDALGNEVLKRVNSKKPSGVERVFHGGDFESWLSRISEDQPDLTHAENLENRALAERCIEEIGFVLEECGDLVMSELTSSPWLLAFLSVLHARQATVITFNQDTLVELAVDAARWDSWGPRDSGSPIIRSHDCINDLPPAPRGWLGLPPPKPTFRLLKLHGSTNWFWQPNDVTGMTISRWHLPVIDRPVDREADLLLRKRELPGRVPLVIPPLAIKSPFYRNPFVSQLWQDARRALSSPQLNLTLIGYSLPPTDLVTFNMLRETVVDLQRATAPTVEVVDIKPTLVEKRLSQFGMEPSQISSNVDMATYLPEYQRRAARELVSELRMWNPNESVNFPMIAGVAVESATRVDRVEISPDELSVESRLQQEPTSPHIATGNMPGTPVGPSFAEVLNAIRNSKAERIVAITQDGRMLPIIAAAEHVQYQVGDADRWQVLIISDSPRTHTDHAGIDN